MELFFRQYGTASKKLVIMHGLYGSSDNWMTVARQLAETHSVYCLDLRNHGHSPHADTHSYQDLSSDLHQFLLTHKLGKASILGHSMGGKAAMCFAAKYPHLVDKLVVADICPKNYLSLGASSQIHEHRMILEALVELGRNPEAFSSRKEMLASLEDKLHKKDLVMFLSKSLPYNRETLSFDMLINAELLYQYLDHIIADVDISCFEDSMPITEYPCLFVRGLQSNYIQDADIPLIKQIYPEAKIADIPNAGHWLHVEQTELFINKLQAFL